VRSTEAVAAALDLEHLQAGENEVPVTENCIRNHGALRVQSVEPRAIRVRAIAAHRQNLPVEVDLAGELANGLELAGPPVVDPPTIDLIVPASDEAPKSVVTAKVRLDEISATSSHAVDLVLPELTRLPNGDPQRVDVKIRVRRKEN
jgi:YbbR domain-containing protein